MQWWSSLGLVYVRVQHVKYWITCDIDTIGWVEWNLVRCQASNKSQSLWLQFYLCHKYLSRDTPFDKTFDKKCNEYHFMNWNISAILSRTRCVNVTFVIATFGLSPNWYIIIVENKLDTLCQIYIKTKIHILQYIYDISRSLFLQYTTEASQSSSPFLKVGIIDRYLYCMTRMIIIIVCMFDEMDLFIVIMYIYIFLLIVTTVMCYHQIT